MYEDQNNIFAGLTEAQRKEARESIVAMVLATDMAQHFDLLGKFKSKLAGNGFDPKDRKDRLLLLQIAIKCAGILHFPPFNHHWDNRKNVIDIREISATPPSPRTCATRGQRV